MKGRGKWNPFGLSSEFITKKHVTSLISSTKEKLSAEVRNANALPRAGENRREKDVCLQMCLNWVCSGKDQVSGEGRWREGWQLPGFNC